MTRGRVSHKVNTTTAVDQIRDMDNPPITAAQLCVAVQQSRVAPEAC